MNQKELAQKIGTSERTLRRMSPTKRKQWQELAAKGRTIAWFDVLAQLMFEVEAFNKQSQHNPMISINIDSSLTTVHHFIDDFEVAKSFWITDIEQLTKALQYAQSLN